MRYGYDQDTYFNKKMILIGVIAVCIIIITVGVIMWYNSYMSDGKKALQVQQWIGQTDNCRELTDYVIGDPNNNEVKIWYYEGGQTYNMAEKKLNLLIAQGVCGK